MDYRTAAALSQNLSGIGNMFMQMNDPRARAEATLVGNKNALLGAQVQGQNIENQYRPGLMGAQTDSYRGSAANAFAGADLYKAKTFGEGQLNNVRGMQIGELPHSNNAADAYYPDIAMPDGTLAPPPLPVGGGELYTDDVSLLPDLNQPASAAFRSAAAPQLTPQQRLERQIAMQAIAAPGHSQDVARAAASASALFSTTPEEMDRGYAGQGVNPYNATTAADNAGLLERARLAEAGAMDRTVADNDLKARTAIFGAMTGGGVGGTRASTTRGGAPDAFDGAKEIGGATVARFSLDGATIGQGDMPMAQSWAASVSELTSSGVPFEVAKSIADAHHGLPKENDPWYAGPSKDYKDFNETPITREQAIQAATRYGGGAQAQEGGRESDTIRAAISTGLIAPMQQPAATETVQQGTPPMLARPAEPVPQTGVEPKASDAFKRKESSTATKDKKLKETKIQGLEREIKGLTKILTNGKKPVTRAASGFPGAGFGSGMGQASSAPLSNDGYNTQLARLKQLETQLEALKAPKTAAPADIDQLLQKYQ